MADIRVERRAVPGWVPIAALAILLIAALIAVGIWLNRPPERIGTYDPRRHAGLVIPYEGQAWIPADVNQAVQFPDEAMIRVATVEGVDLYAHPGKGMGGGGGGTDVPPGLETGPYGRIYVKMEDGRYLPMVWRSEVQR